MKKLYYKILNMNNNNIHIKILVYLVFIIMLCKTIKISS